VSIEPEDTVIAMNLVLPAAMNGQIPVVYAGSGIRRYRNRRLSLCSPREPTRPPHSPPSNVETR